MCAEPKVIAARPGRSFRFQVAEPRRVLDLGGAVPVSVTDGRKFCVYHLELCERGWRLKKEEADGSRGPEYVVDTTFGADPAKHWECGCRDWQFRGRGRPCRHVALIAAVEARLGLQEVTRG